MDHIVSHAISRCVPDMLVGKDLDRIFLYSSSTDNRFEG